MLGHVCHGVRHTGFQSLASPVSVFARGRLPTRRARSGYGNSTGLAAEVRQHGTRLCAVLAGALMQSMRADLGRTSLAMWRRRRYSSCRSQKPVRSTRFISAGARALQSNLRLIRKRQDQPLGRTRAPRSRQKPREGNAHSSSLPADHSPRSSTWWRRGR